MKKPTNFKSTLVVLILLTCFNSIIAQTYKPFTVREKVDVKGSMLVIGNNILSESNQPINDNRVNQDINMRYVDIDGDASTFSSSSANLLLSDHEDGSETTCYRVAYAGLYWSAMLKNGEDRASITNIKLKTPGSLTYVNIGGELIYDAVVNPIVAYNNEPGNTPYACYADITNIVSGLSDIEGTYTVADIVSSEGFNNSTGLSAGWSLIVIYEDPELHTKSFTLFDGFSHLFNGQQLIIPVTGFRTPPAGNIDLQFAYGALEGDKTQKSKLEINGKEVLTPLRKPANNFFRSIIENTNGVSHPRNPMSENTLGYDTGFLEIIKANPSYINNNVTSADFRLQVPLGQADPIFAFFSAFAVDIIAPDINLTKIVLDANGNNIDGDDVNLGQNLFYEITYQSFGNDNVTQFTIKDVLPDNIVFDPATDIDLSNAGGATLQSYDPVTRTLIFNIPDGSVEVNDPSFVIRLAIQIVPNCYDLSQACSNEIMNQAFATYRGVINTNWIQEEGSFATTECLGTPRATNLLVDISNCNFERTEVLCGTSILLTASDGYESYSWSTSPTGTPVIGTEQTYTATEPGSYYVTNTAPATCLSIDEQINVITYGADVTNPVIPFADEVVICPNDGKELPNIFLCGANDSRVINTGISDAVSIIWQKLNEDSCAAVALDNCANEDSGCTWNQIATGPNYTANDSGQFRMFINYPGGCFNVFYFNVYQNLLNPTINAKDILCTTLGEVTVGGVPSGYEYSIDGTNYQSSNVFSVSTPGYYTVYIRQIGVNTNPCIFQTPSIYVRARDFTVSTVVTQPFCYGEKGSIMIAANNALPQYYYSIYLGGTLVNSAGPVMASDYTFANLNPGTYTVNVSTDDGCTYSEDIEIIEPPLLTATAALTQPLTCTDGEITVYPNGGTAPYIYYVNGAADSQDSPLIPVTASGVYNITVVDSNNCSAETSITVDAIPAPDFNVTSTDIDCSDSGDTGTISINVTNANGNSLLYSIDNGVTFFSSPIFTGLATGNYDVVVQYTIGTDVCVTNPETITITEPPAITGTATLTTPYTCITNGVITVSGVSGGTAPYTYSLDGINYQSGTTFSGLINGTFTVTIMDARGCTFATAPVTIDPLDPPINMSFSNSPLSCPSNTTDVTITSVTGGTGALEYQIIAPSASATAYQASNIFTGLVSGTYTFQVRDANNCTYSETYSIAPLPVINVVGQTISDVSCFGASDGSARFTVSGTTNFTYTINGGASIAGTSPIDLTGLSAGSHSILVTDATTNCTATALVTINAPTTVLSATSSTSPITCNADGSVVISASGGWDGYTYQLLQPDSIVIGPQGSNIFAGLSQIGIYTATVIDAKGCETTTTFTLNAPSTPTATIDPASDLCYSGSGATIIVNASDGQSPYEYSINGSAFGSNNTFTNLIPGNFDITVRDAYGCTFNIPTQTIADQLTATAVLTKGLDCTVTPDAEVDITISGGTAPFTYEVSFNGGAFSSIAAPTYTYNDTQVGNYQYRITDALGCTTLTNVVTIQPITNPSATASVIDVFCSSDSSGVVTIDVDETVGAPPYQISFNGSAFTSQTVYSGLSAGSYNYTVRDANACEFNGFAMVNEPSAVALGSAVIIPITCSGSGNVLGAITISGVAGGTGNYTYTLLDSSGNLATTSSTNPVGPTASTSVMFNGLAFGNYYLRLVDANGCEYNFGPYQVASNVDALNIDVDASSASCVTGVDYNIEIVNGVGPFRVRIYDGTTTFNPVDGVAPNGLPTSDVSPNERNHQFSGLQFGVSYVFEVLDTSTGCTYIEQVPAEPSPSPMALSGTANSVACLGDTNGTFDFTISGYTGDALSWEVYNNLSNTTTGITGSAAGLSGADYSDTVIGIEPGDYYLLVTETDTGSTQCTAFINFRITEPTELLLAEVVNTNANCNQDAQVVVNGSGGVSPYEYAFVQDGTVPSAGDWTTNNLAILDHTVNTNWDVYLRDSNGCAIAIPLDVIIAADPLPSVTLPPFADDQCSSGGNSYTFTATPGGSEIAPVSYSIDGVNFLSNPTFTVSTSGTYTLTIRDGNGCTATDTITTYQPLLVNAVVSAQPSCTVGGTITATGNGGSGNYSFALLDSLGNPTIYTISGSDFTGVPAGNYIVEITDAVTSCSSQSPISLETPTPVTFSTSANDVSCNGGSDGVIIVTLDAGNNNPPYTYSISGPVSVGPQYSNIFTGLPAGIYDVTVTSSRDCSLTQQETIGEPTPLSVSGTATDFACAPNNSVNTSSLTISVVGGTAPYVYSIDGTNYLSTNTFDIIDTGSPQTINIFVKDTNGCIASNTVSITPLPVLTAASAAIVTPIDCNNTGTVAITVSGGSGDFNYQMLPEGAIQTSNTFSIVNPGDYYFRVYDNITDCYIDTSAFTVTPFDTIDVLVTPISDITCFGDVDGAFEINVSGYSGTYDYEIFDSTNTLIRTVNGANTSTNPQLVTGLPAGSYTVVVTETASPFCSTTSNIVTIATPATALDVAVSETSNVTCDDGQGTITAIASGGWGSYEYELTGAATVAYSPNGTFRNLSAGSYTVNVRDSGGCTVSGAITLTVPTPISATVTADTTLLSCFGDTSAT
ncbi:beta strand repeat-containing protein, partial [Confluentibacter flavum]